MKSFIILLYTYSMSIVGIIGILSLLGVVVPERVFMACIMFIISFIISITIGVYGNVKE